MTREAPWIRNRLAGVALWGAAGAVLFWAGCQEPAAEAPQPAEPAPEPEPEPPPSVEHTVGAGETLWDIAQAYDVSVSDIREANGLRARDVRRLSKGRALTIPGATALAEVPTAADRAARRAEERAALPAPEDGAYHFLGEGETLWDVAHTYDKSVADLMTRNELSDGDLRSLRPGTAIIVPGIRDNQVRTVERRERVGIRHEVVRGETVWDLANAFQVSVAQIMAANGMGTDEVTQLRAGARLFIPGVTEDRGGRITRRETGAHRRGNARARTLGLGTRGAASALLRGRPERSWVRAAGRGRLPGTLRWPVSNGWFVRGYGSGEDGYHLAVDIMGDIGWNVRACAPGIVGYSGNGVRGYGNLVMVVHPGGWITMYAHNSANFVVAGQRVPRGGILAEVGSTGISRGPHVHFELIHNGNNCDPAPLFRPGVRHRSGRLSSIDRVTWTRPNSRPAAIRCAPRRRHPRSRWVTHEQLPAAPAGPPANGASSPAPDAP